MKSKCWFCGKTKEQIIDDLFNLSQDKKLTKEIIGNGVEFYKFSNDDTSCIDVPICNVCSGSYYSMLEETLMQFQTKDEVEEIIKDIRLVVE